VEDYNDPDDIIKDTSGIFSIRGALEIDTPAQVWTVGDTNRSITWDYQGPIQLVDIYLRNRANTEWIPLTPVEGYDCSQKYFDAFTVPDQITNVAAPNTKLRIKDHDDPTGLVEDISGNFTIRGKLTFSLTKPTQDQIFIVGPQQQGEDNTIMWNQKGTIPYVVIRYDHGDIRHLRLHSPTNTSLRRTIRQRLTNLAM